MPDLEPNLLVQPREVTSAWHVSQARRWLAFDGGRQLDSPLVYAAFEARCAIERLLFELLVLAKWPSLSQEDERRCRSLQGLLDVWREHDSEYRKTLAFSRIVARVSPYLPQLARVEPGNLSRLWAEVSDLCHRQLRPELTWEAPGREYQARGYELVSRVLDELRAWEPQVAHGVLDPASMPPEVRETYDLFLAGELDESAAMRRLDLMTGVLEQRFRSRT